MKQTLKIRNSLSLGNSFARVLVFFSLLFSITVILTGCFNNGTTHPPTGGGSGGSGGGGGGGSGGLGFNITGVTGGTDVIADGYLTSGANPTVNFSALVGATTYDVIIKDSTDAFIVCSLTANASSPVAVPGCALLNLTTYKIHVIANNAGVPIGPPANDGLPFEVDNAAPGAFAITGITGGADALVDAYLTSGLNPSVNFSGSTGATAYDVIIKDSTDTVIECMALSSSSSPASPSLCGLTLGLTYKVHITAKSASGAWTTVSSNDGFTFIPDTVAGNFSIAGITGGTDSLQDTWLTGPAAGPVVNFGASAGANTYDVVIKDATDTTVVCQSLGAAGSPVSPAGCPTVEGSSYTLHVTAKKTSGLQTTALNSPFIYTVKTIPPGAFNISGITGGFDNLVDATLSAGNFATLNWTAAAGVNTYNATIYASDGVTVICSVTGLSSATTNYNFSPCALTQGLTYKAHVVALDVAGNPTNATNDLFSFNVIQSYQLVIDGSGVTPSTINGTNITTCGGGSNCNSANPYVISAVVPYWSIVMQNAGYLTGVAWVSGVQAVNNGVLPLNVMTNFTVCSTCKVWMDAKGYLPSTGPGGGNYSGAAGGSGGGYGGTGGSSGPDLGGISYGTLKAPAEMGSGGGFRAGNTGCGNGGGLITINVVGTFTLNGTLSSVGEAGCGAWNTGAGAGGGIYVNAAVISGTGATIAVYGGNGNGGNNGSGAGGRVALITASDTYAGGIASINFQAYGGTSAYQVGGAGTVYLDNTSTDTNGRLYMSENNYTSVPVSTFLSATSLDTLNISTGAVLIVPAGFATTVTNAVISTGGTLNIATGATFNPTSYTFTGGTLINNGTFVNPINTIDFTLINYGTLAGLSANPTIASGGKFVVGTNSLTLTSVTINSGGALTHAANTTAQSYYLNLNVTTLTLNSGGSITGDYLGYLPGNGPGKGTNGHPSSGAAYGGNGGPSNTAVLGGFSYGTLAAPAEIGSGGGIDGGSGCGQGGGLLQITVTGTFTLNGTVTANGQNSCGGWGTSGGAGGGVNIHAGTIAGSTGTISARGGVATGGNEGAGSGGRVALISTNDTYAGGAASITYQVYGGTEGSGVQSGGAGTVFIKNTSTDTNGRLYISNNNEVNSLDTPLLASASFDSINIKAQGNFSIASGVTPTVTTANIGASGIMTIGTGATFNPTGYTFTGGVLVNNGTFVNTISTIDFTLYNYGAIPGLSANLTIANGGKFIVGTNNLTLTSLIINSGGTLTHNPNTTTQSYFLNLNVGTLTLNTGGFISGDYLGYTAGNGPGKGAANHPSSGAAYGGSGGPGAALPGGLPYGTLEAPAEIGSGGGYDGQSYCGEGGGLLQITVTGTFTLNGTVTANGQNSCGGWATSAGSGGGIYINTGTIAGSTGIISSKGGIATGGNEGAGSGGRVALVSTNDTYSGGAASITFQVYGGTSGGGLVPGGAGTVFLKNTSTDTNGRLYMSDNAIAGPNTSTILSSVTVDSLNVTSNGNLLIPSGVTLTVTGAANLSSGGTINIGAGATFNPGSYSFTGGTLINNGTFSNLISNIDFTLINNGTLSALNTNLTISNGGKFVVGTNNLTLTSLTIAGGGILTHSANTTTQSYFLNLNVGTLTLSTGGFISADYLGYQAGNGPGKGAANHPSSGAAYGGNGGPGAALPGGTPYGTLEAPAEIGSGGGYDGSTACGSGGGLLQITVSGTFTLNGTVTANGQNSCGSWSTSAGSGGGINIAANTIAGSTGIISSKGGIATGGNEGAGSGGRVALVYTTDSYSGGTTAINFQVYGGTTGGSPAASAGTVFLKNTSTDTNGRLYMANNNAVTATTSPLTSSMTFDSVTVTNSADLLIQAGNTLTTNMITLNSKGAVTIGTGVTFSPTAYSFTGGQLVNYGTFTNGISTIDFTLDNYGTLSGLNADLTITNQGTFVIDGTTLALNSLVIQNGGTLTHFPNTNTEINFINLTVATNLQIDAGGFINANYMGYTAGNGPGVGLGGGGASGGGSYGGVGGVGQSYGVGGTYGSAASPNELGSGGGLNSCAASGGGLIKINVSGTLTINGTITSNGQSTCGNWQSGAGSGGGINITTTTIAGSTGSISANGGSAAGSNNGGGGGGRISFAYHTDSYSGGQTSLPKTANGGAGGFNPGGVGTVSITTF